MLHHHEKQSCPQPKVLKAGGELQEIISRINSSRGKMTTLRMKAGSTFCLYGMPFSGKTTWMMKFLKHRNKLLTEKTNKVIFCYNTYMKELDELREEIDELITVTTFVHNHIDMHEIFGKTRNL